MGTSVKEMEREMNLVTRESLQALLMGPKADQVVGRDLDTQRARPQFRLRRSETGCGQIYRPGQKFRTTVRNSAGHVHDDRRHPVR